MILRLKTLSARYYGQVYTSWTSKHTCSWRDKLIVSQSHFSSVVEHIDIKKKQIKIDKRLRVLLSSAVTFQIFFDYFRRQICSYCTVSSAIWGIFSEFLLFSNLFYKPKKWKYLPILQKVMYYNYFEIRCIKSNITY